MNNQVGVSIHGVPLCFDGLRTKMDDKDPSRCFLGTVLLDVLWATVYLAIYVLYQSYVGLVVM